MILVTGAAGFIGYHTCKRLLAMGYDVYGIDNLNDYYDRNYKLKRVERLDDSSSFKFKKVDITDHFVLHEMFKEYRFTTVVNLAAQAGVRYSLENPDAYLDSNVIGFHTICKLCNDYNAFLIYASSSSVYGKNYDVLDENVNVNNPASLYGATKIFNELLAKSYYNTYELPSIGLRFSTVYGPWGRPDMAMWIWTDAIIKDKEVLLFNYGDMHRSFTYIDDIINGIMLSISQPAISCDIFNLSGANVVNIKYVVDKISTILDKKPKIKKLPAHICDPIDIRVNTNKAKEVLKYEISVSIDEGLERYVNWHKNFVKEI